MINVKNVYHQWSKINIYVFKLKKYSRGCAGQNLVFMFKWRAIWKSFVEVLLERTISLHTSEHSACYSYLLPYFCKEKYSSYLYCMCLKELRLIQPNQEVTEQRNIFGTSWRSCQMVITYRTYSIWGKFGCLTA